MPRRWQTWAFRRIKADRAAKVKASAKDRADEAAVLAQIRKEAKENGVTLANDGEGGLPGARVLELLRAAKWRCENPKCPRPKKDLDMDHQSGHPLEIREDPEANKDPVARAAAAEKDPKADKFLHVLCKTCHDAVHDRERSIEQGKKPKPMPGRAAR